MQFGVFDHMDASGEPLAELFENRLKLAEAYDRLGLYALHVAEHHSTPLGMSPSPSVFLALAAQRTRRLRLGPLVYTLPLYHPLRLAEEICTLDQLTGGRLELGVGRRVAPPVIAETDREAMEIGRRAYRRWFANFTNLWRRREVPLPTNIAYSEDFDGIVKSGQAIAGSPRTVRDAIARQTAESGVNYVLARLAFGDLSLEESLNSAELLARRVMPELATAPVS